MKFVRVTNGTGVTIIVNTTTLTDTQFVSVSYDKTDPQITLESGTLPTGMTLWTFKADNGYRLASCSTLPYTYDDDPQNVTIGVDDEGPI